MRPLKKLPFSVLTTIFVVAVWIVVMLISQTASLAANQPQDDLYPRLILLATPSPTQHSFIILPEMNTGAAPVDYGAQIYRLVCSACHGDVGQGLTEQWLLTWNPKDQNCWQSKCHASNHPSEGFDLPHYVPPIAGPNIRYLFQTALELHDYIKAEMPWQNKGSLTNEEYWQVTAYVLQMNGIDSGRQILDEQTADQIILRPDQALPISKSTARPVTHSPLPLWVWLGIALALIVFGAAVFILLRAVRR